jgi:hypothetical protein
MSLGALEILLVVSLFFVILCDIGAGEVMLVEGGAGKEGDLTLLGVEGAKEFATVVGVGLHLELFRAPGRAHGVLSANIADAGQTNRTATGTLALHQIGRGLVADDALRCGGGLLLLPHVFVRDERAEHFILNGFIIGDVISPLFHLFCLHNQSIRAKPRESGEKHP